MEELKNLYPKGFLIVVKTFLLHVSGFEIFYYEMSEMAETTTILDRDITPISLDMLVQE